MTIKKTAFSIISVFLLLFFAQAVRADDVGNLGLLVTDKDYNPISQAQVTIDGSSAGKTSSDGTLLLKDLSPGEHTLVVEKEGYQTADKEVEVSPGKTTQVVIKLEEATSAGKSNLVILVFDKKYNAIGGVEVYLNGKLEGNTNQNGNLKLEEISSGEHTVKAEKQGYNTASKSINVEPSQEREVVLNLKSKEGEDTGRTIYVDDDFTDDPKEHKWSTIQKGIDDAESGDTVVVKEGVYTNSFEITKSLSLRGQGAGKSVIDLSGQTLKWSAITINGKKKEIEVDLVGFTINCVNCSVKDAHGPRVVFIGLPTDDRVSKVTIANNTFIGGCRQVHIAFSNTIIDNNIFKRAKCEAINIFHLMPEDTVTVRNNEIFNNVTIAKNYDCGGCTNPPIEWGAISIDMVDGDIRIKDNKITNNWSHGISSQCGSKMTISGNEITLNRNLGINLANSFSGIIQGKGNFISRNKRGNLNPPYPGPPWPPNFKK